jgi:integron integrase
MLKPIRPKWGKGRSTLFLSHLAVKRGVSAATQRQALNAIIFLYRHVLDQPIEEKLEMVRARRRSRPPVVMSKNEVRMVLGHLMGLHLLMTKMLYGSGLRLMECVRLRVHNLDFERNRLYVYAAKGNKDRVTLLPKALQITLKEQLETVKKVHNADLANGFGHVYLPPAFSRKYPNAAMQFRWQYVFPAKNRIADSRTGIIGRHHILESGLQKAVKAAVDRAGITKRVSCHTFRHCFATHLLEDGVNIRVVQELRGMRM